MTTIATAHWACVECSHQETTPKVLNSSWSGGRGSGNATLAPSRDKFHMWALPHQHTVPGRLIYPRMGANRGWAEYQQDMRRLPSMPILFICIEERPSQNQADLFAAAGIGASLDPISSACWSPVSKHEDPFLLLLDKPWPWFSCCKCHLEEI